MLKKRTFLMNIGLFCGMAVLMLFVLFPYFWMITSSLKPASEIFSVIPTLLPSKIDFSGYSYAFSPSPGPDLIPLLTNSLIVAVITSVVTAFFAATGGYGIGRHNFPGMQAIIVFIMIAQMFQGPVIMVPWYKMAARMGVLNTRVGLILIYLTMTVPICVWLMSSFYKGIPEELEEAASIDGCSKMRAFLSIVLPLAKGGLASITIYSFIIAWNDYQYALILTSSVKAKTVQMGIAELIGSLGIINWAGILACGVIITIPVIILFSFVQKYLIEGLTAGAVKG